MTFPPNRLPPVRGFWSLTLYNEHHFFHPNELHRYSLGTKNKTLHHAADGSLTPARLFNLEVPKHKLAKARHAPAGRVPVTA